ncbi:MAG TPA: ATP-binding cassette domain-containing protein, partial [Steroidobacteraceae bacterium]
MLSFASLSLRRGTRLLIKDASFTIYRGEKVGIVGANGVGKSSLLALVLGELQPDSGNFDRPAQLEVAHVSQELIATDQPAIEFVIDGDGQLRETERAIAAAEAANDGVALGNLHAQFAAIGGYDARSRAGKLMHGLGFAPDD